MPSLRPLVLLLALLLPLTAWEAPAQAQRSSLAARRARARRARARRARSRARRARRARARRARARMARARRARLRARRARRRRARARRLARGRRDPEPQPSAADPNAPVDMDFSHLAAEPVDDETPPPMDTSYVEEHEAQVQAERRAALDPELFGEGGDAPEAPSAPREPGRFSPLTARVSARAIHRGLSLVDYQRGPISDYLLPVGAAAGFGFDYYPGAHLFNDALAHVGLSFDMQHSLFVESQGANETSYATTALSWQLGLRYRVPLDDEGSDLGPELGAGQQIFRVERGHLGEPAPEGAPNVSYAYLRIGGSGRFFTGDFFLGVRAAYLPVFDVGPIAGQLGGASAHGAELGVSFSYPIDYGFSFLAELDARMYFLSATPNEESESSAGGAIDRFIGLSAGVEWRMPPETEL